MTKPLVSICIPTYNGDKYLVECLNSCIDQSFKDYEIIICDDCSSDKTISIIEEYASKYPFIKFYKNEQNLGLVGNWNKCLEQSSGEWIKLVFQDDYMTSNCIQKFVDQIRDQTRLIVCKRHFILPENADAETLNYYTNVVRTLENTTNYKGAEFSPELISKIAVENMCMNFIGEPSLIFFRKNLIQESGLFNSHLKQICDLEFALKIASKYGLTYLPEQLCPFRIHHDSTTNRNSANMHFETTYIEPVLFSYFLLFGEYFKSFRANLNFLQKFKLNLYFKVKTYIAYSVNISENRDYPLFSKPEPQFKEVQKHKKGSLWVKLVAFILYR